MSSEACETGTGETAHIVGAGCLYTTVGGPIEQSVVDIALVNVHTLGLLQAGVADHPGHAVVVIATANLSIAADSVEFVAVSVAAVVRGAVAEPGRVVGVLSHREVLGVEAEIVPTSGPARQGTVGVCLAVTLGLTTGLAGRTSSLTTVISVVPTS